MSLHELWVVLISDFLILPIFAIFIALYKKKWGLAIGIALAVFFTYSKISIFFSFLLTIILILKAISYDKYR